VDWALLLAVRWAKSAETDQLNERRRAGENGWDGGFPGFWQSVGADASSGRGQAENRWN
jgi:hypothetical protein